MKIESTVRYLGIEVRILILRTRCFSQPQYPKLNAETKHGGHVAMHREHRPNETRTPPMLLSVGFAAIAVLVNHDLAVAGFRPHSMASASPSYSCANDSSASRYHGRAARGDGRR